MPSFPILVNKKALEKYTLLQVFQKKAKKEEPNDLAKK